MGEAGPQRLHARAASPTASFHASRAGAGARASPPAPSCAAGGEQVVCAQIVCTLLARTEVRRARVARWWKLPVFLSRAPAGPALALLAGHPPVEHACAVGPTGARPMKHQHERRRSAGRVGTGDKEETIPGGRWSWGGAHVCACAYTRVRSSTAPLRAHLLFSRPRGSSLEVGGARGVPGLGGQMS